MALFCCNARTNALCQKADAGSACLYAYSQYIESKEITVPYILRYPAEHLYPYIGSGIFTVRYLHALCWVKGDTVVTDAQYNVITLMYYPYVNEVLLAKSIVYVFYVQE